MNAQSSLGATYHEENGKTNCLVWAPFQDQLELKLLSPGERVISMQREENGYHFVELENAPPGTRYKYILNQDRERLIRCPAISLKGFTVHRSAESQFSYLPNNGRDFRFRTILFMNYILEPLPHREPSNLPSNSWMLWWSWGNRDRNHARIPVPGERNWGYDGVYPFAHRIPMVVRRGCPD